MSILRRAALAALVTAASSLPAFAWEVMEDWRDPIGGRTYTAAGATNDAGMSIVIFRDMDEKVRAVYSIPESSFDRLPKEGRVLAIRPGQLSVVEIEAEIVDNGITEKARSDGRHVRDLLWHGSDPSPTRGTLRDILDSDTLFARFYTDTGGQVDTSWSLKDAPAAIANALDIEVAASPEDIAWSTMQADLLLSSTRRCERDVACMREMTKCMRMLESMADVDRFKRCVETVAP